MFNSIAGAFVAFGALIQGMMGGHGGDNSSSTRPHFDRNNASTTRPFDGERSDNGNGSSTAPRMGQGVLGTVTVVSGNTITLDSKRREGTTTADLVFIVDASNAKIVKGPANPNASTSVNVLTVADIKVGDIIMVQGVTTGNTVVAKTIFDGRFFDNKGLMMRGRNASSTAQIRGEGEGRMMGRPNDNRDGNGTSTLGEDQNNKPENRGGGFMGFMRGIFGPRNNNGNQNDGNKEDSQEGQNNQ